MPLCAAHRALQEPEHELTVVQQVHKGSINSVGTKAQLTVKLPGVASADDVQVRCTFTMVSVGVPGRYLLQLSLPFRIRDEAESVKFSSKKQPATLTVTMAVEGGIQQQQQQAAASSPAQQLSPAAAVPAGSSSGSRCRQGHQTQPGQTQQQQQQQSQQPAEAGSSNSSSRYLGSPNAKPLADALFMSDPCYGKDQRKWLLPYAVATDWMNRSGANAAADSLLWTLSPYPPPTEGKPSGLVRLTPGNLVLALLALLLRLFMGVTAFIYMVGLVTTPIWIDVLTSNTGEWQLQSAYTTYLRELYPSNNPAAVLMKLTHAWLMYSTLWQVIKLLRVNVLLQSTWAFSWPYVLQPLLLGLFWQPRLVFTVPFTITVAVIGVHTSPNEDHFASWFAPFLCTQAVIYCMNGGWQTVATLLLAASFYLPRLPRPRVWPRHAELRESLVAAVVLFGPGAVAYNLYSDADVESNPAGYPPHWWAGVLSGCTCAVWILTLFVGYSGSDICWLSQQIIPRCTLQQQRS